MATTSVDYSKSMRAINTVVKLDGTTSPTTINVTKGKHYALVLQRYDKTQDHFVLSNATIFDYLSHTAVASSYNAIQLITFEALEDTIQISNGSPSYLMLIQLD